MCTFGPPWSSFHFPNPLASGKHKSDLFSYECICMFLNYDHSIIQSLCYTTWWFSISIPIKVTLEYSLLLSVTMQRHCIISMLPTLYSSYSWLICFAAWSLCLLIYLFLSFLDLLPLRQPPVLCIYESVSVMFIHLCCFLDPMYE